VLLETNNSSSSSSNKTLSIVTLWEKRMLCDNATWLSFLCRRSVWVLLGVWDNTTITCTLFYTTWYIFWSIYLHDVCGEDSRKREEKSVSKVWWQKECGSRAF
jgi:hypothetical protein